MICQSASSSESHSTSSRREVGVGPGERLQRRHPASLERRRAQLPARPDAGGLTSRHDAGTRAAPTRRRPARPRRRRTTVEAHSGQHAVAVARAHGVEVMFTLSGRPRLPDVRRRGDRRPADADPRRPPRADRRLRRRGDGQADPHTRASPCSPPGPASPTGSARSPRRSSAARRWSWSAAGHPPNRWGSGSLQELDQPPILAPVSKLARTIHKAAEVADGMHEAFTLAGASHRGPVFVDIPMDEFFNTSASTRPVVGQRQRLEPDGDAIADIAELLGQAAAARAGPRHRRLGRRRRGGRAPARRGGRHPGRSPTAWAAASSPAGTRCS